MITVEDARRLIEKIEGHVFDTGKDAKTKITEVEEFLRELTDDAWTDGYDHGYTDGQRDAEDDDDFALEEEDER